MRPKCESPTQFVSRFRSSLKFFSSPSVLLFLAVFLGGQAPLSALFAAVTPEDQDEPAFRDEWFMRGRESPDFFSAAAHRYRAWLQAQSLPVTTVPSGSNPPVSLSLSAPLAVSGACN